MNLIKEISESGEVIKPKKFRENKCFKHGTQIEIIYTCVFVIDQLISRKYFKVVVACEYLQFPLSIT